MKRLFLFDLDGTLVSTGGAGSRAMSRAFLELHGIDDATSKVALAGKTDPAIFREIIQAALGRDIDASEAPLFFERYLEHLAQEVRVPGARGAFNGVKEFLTELSGRADAVLALGTGNLERGARLKLEPHGMNVFFPDGGFGSDAEERAEILRFGHRRAMARMGETISPENVFVIGDTPHDISAARKAGFRVVTVSTGLFSLEALKAFGPDYALPDMSHASRWLTSLTSVGTFA